MALIDLGGMEGFGRLPLEENEPAFHYVWEARVMGMRLLMGGWRKWNIDAGRRSVEHLPPKDYLSLTSCGNRLASLVNQSVKAGTVVREEVARGRPEEGAVRTVAPTQRRDAFLAFIPKGRPSARRITAEPAFRVGDPVRTARHMHSGRTRLPRYLRDCAGEVVRHHGARVFPDVSATLQGEAPEHLYSVRFSATDVCGIYGRPLRTA